MSLAGDPGSGGHVRADRAAIPHADVEADVVAEIGRGLNLTVESIAIPGGHPVDGGRRQTLGA